MFKMLLPVMKGNNKGCLVFIRTSDYASRTAIHGLYESVTKELEASKTNQVTTTLAHVYPKIDESGARNPIFGYITPDDLARNVLVGVAKKQRHLYLPDYMIFFNIWLKFWPAGLSTLVEDFLFHGLLSPKSE